MPVKQVNKVQFSKRISQRKSGGEDEDDNEPSPNQMIDSIIDMLQKLKSKVSDSKSSSLDQVSTDNAINVINGGKGKKKSKSRKLGGADILVGTPIINTSSLLNNPDPTTQANAYVPALFTPPPFSAGIPQFSTTEAGFPDTYLHAMSGKYLPPVSGGGKKGKPTARKAKK